MDVVSTKDMADAMLRLAPEADIVVMTAAVADYTPKEYAPQKIKKGGDMKIDLVRTKDILAELGKSKRPDQLLIGFAAETERFEENAKSKLANKNLDIIALNDVTKPGEGFGSDDNNIRLFFRDGAEDDLGSADKHTLAKRIMAESGAALAGALEACHVRKGDHRYRAFQRRQGIRVRGAPRTGDRSGIPRAGAFRQGKCA